MSHQGQFPAVDALLRRRARDVARRRGRRRRGDDPRAPACPTSIYGSFQGTAQAFRAALANEPLLILAALVTVYIVLGVLYESYIHPMTILSTLPVGRASARSRALLVTGTDFGVIALIGVILLIGIVKKNAIMMIDFALDAERNEGKSPRGRDLRGVAAALPADHDDDDGGAARARCRSRSAPASARSSATRSASRSSAACS